MLKHAIKFILVLISALFLAEAIHRANDMYERRVNR